MKKKILSILVCAIMILGITGCGSKEEKTEDIISTLNSKISECSEQNDERSNCMMNYKLQEYFTTYSDYQLLNASKNEFTAKPQEPNSLFTYGTSRDFLCDYDYALFYNKDSKKYYSVEYTCEDNLSTFTKATELK